MKILFLTENFPPEVNAIASRVYERAVHWVRSGHEVTVITSFPNFPQGRIYPGYRQRLIQRETIAGIEVLCVRGSGRRESGGGCSAPAWPTSSRTIRSRPRSARGYGS